MTNTDSIFEKASALSSFEKARLIDKLISSLDKPDKEIDKLWAKEAEDRINAFERGKIKTVTAKEVFNKIESRQK